MKTCFITGGNSGIGKAAAIQLAEAGYRVAIGCRNPEKGESALADLRAESPDGLGELVVIDMASRESIRKAADEVHKTFGSLDVLIHNAADFNITRKEPAESPDGVETIWATNHLGPVYLTGLLMDALKKGSPGRILTVASQGLVLHPKLQVNLKDPEFADRPYSVADAYYQSKLAHLMYSYHLAKELEGSGITVNCIRVTNVKIDINRYPDLSKAMKFMYSIKSRFSITPEEMASVYTWLADDDSLQGKTGGYYDEKKRLVNSSRYSRDEYEIRRVMNLTRSYLEGGDKK